jgi:hypothetical protein
MGLIYMARGNAVGAQTTPGTAAVLAAANWLNWCTRCEITDQINSETPNVLAYRIWMASQVIPLTRLVQWTIEGLVDTWQWGWFLKSFDGAPTGAGPYVFSPGKNAGSLLTIAKVNKNRTKYRKVIDGVCTELRVGYNVANLLTFTATGLAILSNELSSPPTPSYVTPGDKSPIRNNWPVVTVNNVATGVESAEFTLRQQIDPYYESLIAEGDTGAGVAPVDWEVESMGMEYNITRKERDDGTGGLDYLRSDTTLATNSFSAHDPGAMTKGVVITIPNMKSTQGSEQEGKAVARENFQGAVLYTPGSATGATFSFLGDAGFGSS